MNSRITPARLMALDPRERDEVLALAGIASSADGADPLGEDALLRIRSRARPASADSGDAAVHLLVHADEELVGYAQVASTAELVVHPLARGRGIGRALVRAVVAESPPHGIWAHGDHPSASALAITHALAPARMLWRMRRPLSGLLDLPPLPEGVVVRAFRPGTDDGAWLELNRRAFVALPDQAGWGPDDLAARMGESWFDPAGFLLAERVADGALLGFHWTKVHPGRHGGGQLGEVYVVGVDPAAQGLGLGATLTMAGLRHLREVRGLDQVMLYVDGANSAAVRLYQRLGFARWSTDVCYRPQ